MNVPARYIFLACALLFAAAFAGEAAFADCVGCQRPPSCQQNCQPTPPPVCHNCAPPSVVVPPPRVTPPNVVIMGGAGAQAQASATSIAVSHARSGDTIIRMGGVSGYAGAYAEAGVTVGALSVSEGFAAAAADRMALLQAVCITRSGAEHPASQTFAGRSVRDEYSGELYRCIAGARLRYTMDGASQDCAAGEALWYENGALSCRRQIARRDCNERSLLRRFGAGDKLVRIRETRTAEPAADMQMTMDGGVGQGVW